MKSSVLLFSALALAVRAFPGNLIREGGEDGVDCGNADTFDTAANPPFDDASPESRATAVQIDAFAHIIVSKKFDKPAVEKEIVQKKIDYLNKNFKPLAYHFNLKDTDISVNTKWAGSFDNAFQARPELRRGDYQTLNVYLVEGATSALGYLPVKGTLTQAALTADGVFVPWGRSTNSTTLTHEVGHWMNLLHVFDGNCKDTDGCDDTFPQNGPSYAKLTKPGDRDTCPVQKQCNGNGKQNVKNYMDYSDCAQEFTKCQGKRMDAAWKNLRKGRKVGE